MATPPYQSVMDHRLLPTHLRQSICVPLVLAIMWLAGGQATAQPTLVTKGQAIAEHGTTPGRAACAACHMANGAGQPEVGIPRLAGLTSSYIADQLGYFASGARQNAAMSSYAAMLSPAERLEVADYFASLALPPPTPDVAATPAQLARGKDLFLNGDERAGLLGCSQCHGPTGLGVGDFSPRLAGQSEPYLQSKLQEWRSGSLRDPKGIYMRAIASHLSPADLQSVAAYVASVQKGPHTP